MVRLAETLPFELHASGGVQRAVYPPSTGSATPMTKLAPRLQSHSTEAAIDVAATPAPIDAMKDGPVPGAALGVG